MKKEELVLRQERLQMTISGLWNECKETDTQYRIEESSFGVFLSFPGTITTLDWLQNLDFFQIPYKEQSIIFYAHKGFTKKYQSVKDEIHTILKGIKNEKSLYIQGISQGAALAQLAHEDIGFNFPNKFSRIDTIAFASPRVFSSLRGRKVLKKRMQGLVRIQNIGDIVPHLPPRVLFYKSFGECIKIGNPLDFWKLSIKKHDPKNYIDGLI